MTRQEIEQLNEVEPYCFETDREEQWYRVGLKEGLEASDANPKSHWISVEKDLPCNHPELITCESSIYSEITIPVIAVIHNFIIMSRMYKEDGKWYWENDEPTHWMPIPELPKKIGDKIMTREQAKESLPIIQAFVAGKQIQDTIDGSKWFDTDEINFEYEGQKIKHRIKPESEYRPFNSQEECWNEMLKHHPFGWIKSTISDNFYTIESISDEINYNRTFASFNEAFSWCKFADGTPFGIKEF